MRKAIEILSLLLIINVNLSGQVPEFLWANQTSGLSPITSFSVAIGKDGAIYNVGTFVGKVDFGHGTSSNFFTSYGGNDIFIQKLDSHGNQLWVYQIGGVEDDGSGSSLAPGGPIGFSLGLVVKTDRNGNIYVIGTSFSELIHFNVHDRSIELEGKEDFNIFILKLDGEGNFIWAKKAGGFGRDRSFNGYDLRDAIQFADIDEDGNIYVCGSFKGTIDFDSSPNASSILSSLGDYDIFIQKISSSGHFVWAKQVGGFGRDIATCLHVASNGSIYVGGAFEESITISLVTGQKVISSNSVDYASVFLLKTNKQGLFLWTGSMGSKNSYQQISDISSDRMGNVIITGTFQGDMDVNYSLQDSFLLKRFTPFGSDVFIQKVDSTGHLIWAGSVKGNSVDICGSSISTDNLNNIYIVGHFYGLADFDPSENDFMMETLGNSYNIFIQKIGSNGAFQWATQINGDNDKAGWGKADSIGNIIISGYFRRSIDCDPSASSSHMLETEDRSAFILKLARPTVTENTEPFHYSEFKIFPNPTRNNFTIALEQDFENISMSIFSVEGKLVYRDYFQQMKSMDFSLPLDPNVYFVKLVGKSFQRFSKLIIQ